MYTLLPFLRYSPAISPRRPNSATLCHSVRSLFSPDCLSFQLSLVAMRMFATVMPEGMARVSGSAPRLPMRMTLLIPRAIACPSSEENVDADCTGCGRAGAAALSAGNLQYPLYESSPVAVAEWSRDAAEVWRNFRN